MKSPIAKSFLKGELGAILTIDIPYLSSKA
jgi:hypothetical protein